jgi:hypothetical protein
MKAIILFIFVLAFTSCIQPDKKVVELQSQIDSLQKKLENSYKPGVGDIMIGIQMHHAKLWYAGTNGNWKLAKFQIHEIEEAIEDIQNFHPDTPESQGMAILNNSVENIESAISRGNAYDFKIHFSILTNNCNTCHHANKVEFNVIKVPDTPTFSNQNFFPLAEQ